MNKHRIVITGMGVVTPVGCGIGETFDALIEKRCGVRRISAFDPGHFTSQIGGEVIGGDATDAVPKTYKKVKKVMARDIELAVIAAYHAVKDAGLVTKCLVERKEAEGGVNVDSTRFGANIGAGLICADLNELAGALATSVERPDAAENRGFSLKKWGTEGMSNLTPLWLLKFLPNMLACHVTIVHDCQGPSNTLTCGEASSHLAIGEAFRTAARGATDVCICGGAESRVNPMSLMRLCLMERVVTDLNDRPEEACRPFDVKRCGSVVSEGGGLLILESLEHAKKRNARIYGEIAGFGASANNAHWMVPQSDGRGLATAIRRALSDADVTPDQVDLINAAGVGTVDHDAAEAAALRGVFGDRIKQIPVLATKGALGNSGAGSGAIDLAISVAAMQRGVIPPSRNTDNVDPACGLNVIRGEHVDARVNVILSVATALSGGQTAAIVVKRNV